MDLIKALKAWGIQDSAEMYNIRNWGKGYFGINAEGNVSVHPDRQEGRGIDLKKLVDELIVYIARQLLCAGRGMFVASPLSELSHAQALRFQSVERVGDDLRVLARVAGHDEFA